jgi:hypothetical protein
MMTDKGNGFYAWDGKLFHSDIIRACIRPKAKAVGKLVGKHIRETITADGKTLTINPDAYIRFLLEEPNPYMTGQVMQEKLETQLCLNNNAFAVIVRDDRGCPMEIYPVPAAQVDAIYDAGMNLYLKFYFPNGRQATFPYSDVIHLRHDVYENDIFGESPVPALSGLMDVINTTDQGIIRAIKNSSIIQWLLKFTNSLRPEDLQKQATDFANNYLSINSASVGVAAVDSKAEAVRVEPKDYVRTLRRWTERQNGFTRFLTQTKKSCSRILPRMNLPRILKAKSSRMKSSSATNLRGRFSPAASADMGTAFISRHRICSMQAQKQNSVCRRWLTEAHSLPMNGAPC